jgi:SAM-dependent methyltransferase
VADQPASANAAQAEYWNSGPAQTWINCQAALDQRLAPLTELLIARAGVRPGDCVIDVGCGTGTTTLRLAAEVGAHGSVLAIDISQPLLALARRRCLEQGHANVRLIRADAQTHRFERGCHDLVVSRFGVMFFDDPVGAFRNLAGALRPRGRLAFSSWAPLEANPWFALPLQVGIERFGPPAPQPPRAPGPLALSEPDYIEEILSTAGFADIRIERTETWLPGAASPREEAALAGQVGPLARLLREREVDDSMRAELIAELAGRLAPYLSADGMRLPAVVHLVTAAARQGSEGSPGR